MELLKAKDNATYKYKDVEFYYRTEPTAGDKLDLDALGHLLKNGQIQFNVWEWYKALIKVFVVGWKGVTDNSLSVPWAYETFISRFPADGEGGDMILDFAQAIAKETGLDKNAKADSPKNV